MAGVRTAWHIPEFERVTTNAARRALQATLEDAAAQAQQPGYVPVDEGNLKNDIQAGDVEVKGDRITGWFGAPTIAYAFIQEVNEDFAHDNGGPHYLRRAADKVFPSFPERLSREVRG